jgi:hypothetical protein
MRETMQRELAAAIVAVVLIVAITWAVWGVVWAALFWTFAIWTVTMLARAAVDWLYDRLMQ